MSNPVKPQLRLGLWHDFRNPPAWRRPYDQLHCDLSDQRLRQVVGQGRYAPV